MLNEIDLNEIEIMFYEEMCRLSDRESLEFSESTFDELFKLFIKQFENHLNDKDFLYDQINDFYESHKSKAKSI